MRLKKLKFPFSISSNHLSCAKKHFIGKKYYEILPGTTKILL